MQKLWRYVGGLVAVLLLQLAFASTSYAQTAADFDHSATGFVLNAQHQNVRCETCHTKGQFKGTPTTCEACHGWNNPRASTVMPTNHIPTRNAPCESCHAANMSQFQDALRVFSHVSVPAMSCLNCHDSRNPHPGVRTNPSDATHAKVLSSNTACGVCHTTIQFEGPKAPSNHIPIAPVACTNCHVGGDFSVMPSISAIHANAPSSSSNCAQCHSAAAAAAFAMPTMTPAIVAPPSNHIPMNGQSCEVCHVGAGSSVTLPVVQGANFANARFSHSGISSGCANCHGPAVNPSSFAGMSNIVRMPDTNGPGPMAHIPSSTNCETCHAGSMPSGQISATATATVPGTGFQMPKPTKDMVHAGITGNCSSCHETNSIWLGVQLYPMAGYTGFQTRPQLAAGTYNAADPFHPVAGDCSQCHIGISFDPSLIRKPPNHIPTSAACAACHKNADYKVMPGLTDIHANAQAGSSCATCHSTANAANYPMTPALVTPPAGHIDMGTLGCEACHVGSGSSMPTTTVLDGAKFSGSLFSHSGISSGCDACHGANVTASTYYGLPAIKTLSSLMPAHMPTTAACENCHVGNVPTVLTPAVGVSFAGAKFSHTGITSGCANCHGPAIVPGSFAGNPAIVVMPTTGTSGAVHIPSSVTCENCHLGSTPSTLLDGNATKLVGPGTRFQNPAPTSSMIHANSDVSSCNTCHETGRNWIGMTMYPGSPTTYTQGANYTGFQTRPNAAGGGFSVLDGSHTQGGDCVTCHTGFTGFTTPVPPAGHIPISSSARCGDCHTSPDFNGRVSLTSIHRFAPSTSSNCAQCHSAANAPLYKLKYATVTSITAPPDLHIPMGSAGCETCHVGAGSSIATTPVVDGALFSNSKFSHTGMDKPCSTCHGVNVDATTYTGLPAIKAITYAAGPNKHMPVSSQLGCDTCHINSVPPGLVPNPSASFAGAQFTHAGITAGCDSCHGPNINASSFMGGGNIVVMPSSLAAGPASHIPSSTACEACHMGSMPAAIMAGAATNLTGPGTRFQTPPPSSAVIHANSVVTACETCHGSGKEWIGVNQYPSTPPRNVAPVRGTVYNGFQTRPGGGGNFAVNDSGHTAVETCGNCHTGYTGFGPPTMPSTHIPVSSTAVCANCHTSADYAVMPAYSNIHKYAPSSTTNCAQCHSEQNAGLYPMTPSIKAANVLVAPAHMPMGNLGCESCHLASVANLTTNNSPSFAGAQFSHSGVTSGCAACHVIGTGPFQGTSNIIAIPATAGAPGPNTHVPSSTTCETCHLGSTPSTLLPAVATNAVTNSAFATPVPTSAMVHTGVTTTCNTCHEILGGTIADVWMNMSPYPATTAAPFKGFQTRPTSAVATTFKVQDAAHPTGGDCASCHTSFTDFASAVKPTNHIPTAAVACSNCHTTSNYSAMPTLTAIHANAPSTTGNCAQCHSAANAAIYNQLAGMGNALVSPNNTHVPMGNLGCENCHVSSGSGVPSLPVLTGYNFKSSAFNHSGITNGCATCHGDLTTPRSFVGPTQTLTPKAMPAAHVPNVGNVGCEVCHTNVPSALSPFTVGVNQSTTFATTQYSHKGISSNCSTCHAGTPAFTGISNMVVLPATTVGQHIPSSSAISSTLCEACHLGSTPTALVGVTGTPRAMGTTGFLSPLPTGAMIHNGVTSGCNTCHENPNTWLGVQLYPRSPTTKISGATYVGFQTRPVGTAAGTYSITDSSHPTAAAGDCSKCHGSTTSFSVSAMPKNHIPTSASATCDACHTNINLANGSADFSQMPTLTNIHRWAPSQSANCAQCHSDTNAALYANPTVAGMAVIKSPSSIARHVPIGTTACEVCHLVTGPVVNGSTFAGGKFSHSGITTGCATCHGNGLAANYFTGITNLVAIPATAAMGSTSHIPYTAACETCHAGSTPATLYSVTGSPASPSAFRLPAPTGSMIHGSITSGCNACHEANFVWKGVDLYPITPATKTTGASYKGFQTRPIAAPVTTALGKFGVTDSSHPLTGDCSQCHAGTTVFTALAMPAGHMPTNTMTCSVCHSSDYSVAGLGLPGNLANLHTGIKTGMVTYTAATIGTKTCVTCHTAGTGGTSGTAPFAGCATAANCAAPPPLNAYQPTLKDKMGAHVPIGTLDCNGCHAAVTPNFVLSSMMKNQTMHDNAKLGGVLCKDCHENGMSWYGVTGLKTRIPSKHTTPARMAPNNCDNAGCHANSTVSNGFRMLPQPIMREALVSPDMARVRPVLQTTKPSRGTLGNAFDHKGVNAGQCKTCHDGKAASGMPGRHLMVNTSCDTCHRTTTWTPAHFSHDGVTVNTCMACHNGMSASAKPAGHFMTARSCDSCHKPVAWKPVAYQHVSPQYHPSPDMLSCVSCHVTNGEIIPRQMRGLNRTKPIPVGP